MKEELSQKYEDIAWKEATKVVNAFMEVEKMDEAKKQARGAIINWEEEGKTDVVDKFKEWLKEKNLILDENQ